MYRVVLAAKAFRQTAGVDYFEDFGPVCRYTNVGFVLARSKYNGWKRFQLEVKIRLLKARLDGELYVSQPAGFVVEGKKLGMLIRKGTL